MSDRNDRRSHHSDSSRRDRSRSYSPDDRRRGRSRSRSPDDHSRHSRSPDDRHRSPNANRTPRKTAFRDSKHKRNFTRPSRDELYTRKVLPLTEYRKDYCAGKYTRLSHDDKLRMFGIGVMPIFVPLAVGETEEQYETRFRAWIRRTANATFDEVHNDSDMYRERMLRIQFAIDNAKRIERFEVFDWSKEKEVKPKDQERADGEALQLREDVRGSAETSRCPSKHSDILNGLAAPAIVEAHLSCGCTPCLFAIMDRMARQLRELEGSRRSERSVPVDLTHDDDRQSPNQVSPSTTTDLTNGHGESATEMYLTYRDSRFAK